MNVQRKININNALGVQKQSGLILMFILKLKECIETKPNTSRCPLCHMNIREGEKSWREHLMGVDGCVKNPRRLQALKKSNINLI